MLSFVRNIAVKWVSNILPSPLMGTSTNIRKEGTLPYNELTERIHLFYKTNQEIYKEFNYTERYLLVLSAKMKLGRPTDQDFAKYGVILDRLEYDEEID